MVEGFSPIETVITDLDGTLVRGNTMRILMRMLPGILLRKGKLPAATAAIAAIGLRALRMISHRRMKWILTRAGKRHLKTTDWESLADSMAFHADKEIESFIDARRKRGARVCLATAAMSEYAVPLGKKLGCDYVIATEFNPDFSDYYERKGVEKLKSIKRLLKENGLDAVLFLTDHTDDLPTMEEFPDRTVLVNPSQHTLTRLTIKPTSIIYTKSRNNTARQ